MRAVAHDPSRQAAQGRGVPSRTFTTGDPPWLTATLGAVAGAVYVIGVTLLWTAFR